jgi:hypothetical protein
MSMIKLPDGAWAKAEDIVFIYFDGTTIELETANPDQTYSVDPDDCKGFTRLGEKDVTQIVDYIATSINSATEGKRQP